MNREIVHLIFNMIMMFVCLVWIGYVDGFLLFIAVISLACFAVSASMNLRFILNNAQKETDQ